MGKHLLLLLLVGAIATACGPEDETVTSPGPVEQVSLYDQVYDNCLAVELAVFRFSLDNGGSFPLDVSDVNDAGKTLIDYLPDGSKLINPATGLATEPQDMHRPPIGDPIARTEYSSWDADGDGFAEAFVIGGFTDPEVDLSQPQISYCVASEESGLCGQ